MKFRTALLWSFGILVVFASASCRTTLQRRWVDLNVVFSPKLSSAQRAKLVSDLRLGMLEISSTPQRQRSDKYRSDQSIAYILRYIDSLVPKTNDGINKEHHQYRLHSSTATACSCKDSLLWNFSADITVDHSGSGTPTPTRPKPRPVPVQGGSVQYFGSNDSISKFHTEHQVIDPDKKLVFPDGFSIADSGFVAVIDTGIDTSLIDPPLRKFIIPFGPQGSRNTLVGATATDYRDQHEVRHGTSVTALMLEEYYRTSNIRQVPRVMVLKALGDNGEGDLFSLCCAMSYAARASANLINLSAGYYDTIENGTLNYYLKMCRDSSIPVIAAAGNDTSFRDTAAGICNQVVNPANLLIQRNPVQRSHLFFPAVQSGQPDTFGVISVTGLSSESLACFYQNYSDSLVTVGVMNKKVAPDCCAYRPSFFSAGNGIEGTSFATPIVSGRLASKLLHLPRTHDYQEYLRLLNVINPPSPTSLTPRPSKTFIAD